MSATTPKVKFTVEAAKFNDLLSKAFLYDGNAIADVVQAEFSKSGLVIRELFSKVIGIHLVAGMSFFKDFEVTQDMKVAFTTSFRDKLLHLKHSEVVSVEVTEAEDGSGQIQIFGNKEGDKEDLITLPPHNFPLTIVEAEGVGLLPKNAVEVSDFVAQVPVTELSDTRKPETMNFVSSDSGLRLNIESYYRDITLKQSKKLVPSNVNLSTGYFNRLIHNLSDDAWFLIGKEAIVLAQTKPDLSTLMLLNTAED